MRILIFEFNPPFPIPPGGASSGGGGEGGYFGGSCVVTIYLKLLSSNFVFNSHLGADLIFWSQIPPPPGGGVPVPQGGYVWGYVGRGHIFKGIKLKLGVKTLFGCKF